MRFLTAKAQRTQRAAKEEKQDGQDEQDEVGEVRILKHGMTYRALGRRLLRVGSPIGQRRAHSFSFSFAILCVLCAFAVSSLPGAAGREYDVVIVGGRVMDPASGTDRVADVGIRGNKIATTNGRRLTGKVVLEARGKVVAPGFVDILAGTHPEGDRYKLMDGVTTVLSTHGGPVEVGRWLSDQASRGPLVNYGTVVGHSQLRALAGATDKNVPATPEQVRKMVQLAERAHQEGAIGVGFGIEYIPGTSGEEVTELAAVAARHRTSLHAHIRLPHLLDPFQGINELIAAGAATGARVQVVHIGSMAIRRQKEALALISRARGRGIDIAADVYPYDAWMTRIESAIFDPGWQQKYLLDYKDLVWVATGERITAETFPKFRAMGGAVACHQIPEEEIEAALAHPTVSVASDGYIGEGPSNHPRGAGTFCRVLGRYVRERKLIPLMTALRKMTVQPVQRLEAGAAALKTKGRLSPGMDADVTVFDPAAVIDNATYQNPKQYSTGIRHVLVNGTVVVREGKLVVEKGGAGVAVRSGAR
jgi:N-acyl-D-aspartate/D-glutamate deacylase